MRIFTTLLATLLASAAQAHPGHLAEVAGHGHWLGAAAIGAAIAIGLWKAAQDKKASREEAPEDEGEEAEGDLQEA
ncbi:DUF6732 family protein [Marimonas lutisalis]|uniref:DUF6732 family protein n=1 Tax=Marimonas lutisalis TaxID=2545756 RepID=UPI0010F49C72|nr:DUF6732 family protein [Marimonas lutisalis]